MNAILKNKKIIIPIGIVLAIVLIFLTLLFTAKARVVGVWQRETSYLEHYGCDATMVVEFNSDGTATEVLTNAHTGAVLNIESGYWSMSGFKVSYREPGDSAKTPYVYNPFNNTLNNGGGWFPDEGDNIFHKIN